jgi:hypothetical protein
VTAAQARYFARRSDGLQAPPMHHMLHAVVDAAGRGSR